MESEPNNTPAEALALAGETTVIGSMSGSDQDAFLWTVSDVDALKRWTFELHGVPGRLTIVEIIRLQYAENGQDVVGFEKLMKMGTRDGFKPSVHENLMFEPGEYLLGIAGAGGGGEGGMFRPPDVSLSFGEEDTVEPMDAEPGGYRLNIREGTRIPVAQAQKSRGSPDSAHKMRIDAEYAALTEESENWYRFPFKEQHSSSRWTLAAQVPVGRGIRAQLFDSEQTELAEASSDTKGKIVFPELSPPVGDWYVRIDARKDSGFIQSISSHQVGERVEGQEAEPNDKWAQANRLDSVALLEGSLARGKVNKSGDSDYFQFVLDAGQTDSLLQWALDNPVGQKLRFCLLDNEGQQLQCRDGAGTLVLPDLVLMPGEYGLAVSRGKEGTEYSVSLQATAAINPAAEAEPNDSLPLASSVSSKNRVKGTFSGDDTDYFRFVIANEPQLWRFQVIGDNIEEVGYLDSGGSQAQRIRPRRGERRARLENVFLLPGVHHLVIRGKNGGDYTLLARPLGPPDPNGEREPNNDTSRMQNLAIGQARTGLLLDRDDIDLYRFFLANDDHIRLTIKPPPDGSVQPSLYWYGNPMKETTAPGTGEVIVLEGVFPPGDYHFSLKAPQPSDGEYTVSLERLERFSCATDCEPNDNPAFANPVKSGQTIDGRSGDWRDADFFALPVRQEDTEWAIRVTPHFTPQLFDVETRKSILNWDKDAGVFRGTVPAGQAFFLNTTSGKRAYTMELLADDDAAVPAAENSPGLQLELTLEAAAVSAYRRYGQQVAGRLTVNNTAVEKQSLDLLAATSDYRWAVEPETAQIELEPGQSRTVTLDILAPADAWADWPVRISVSAVNESGEHVEAFAEITALREIAGINPRWGWTVPDGLRGGFNLAWAPLGGRLVGNYDSSVGLNFESLFNGIDVYSFGMNFRGGWKGPPYRELVIELGGGQAVDVAGAAINLRNSKSVVADLAHIDLALSLDGERFETVLQKPLSPIKTEQYFTLESPMKARFARLRLEHSFRAHARDQIHLGEWKVISAPGSDISNGQGFNLADPELGGHVVYSRPQSSVDWDGVLLVDEDQQRGVRVKAGRPFEFVLGFHHNRAARIGRVEWFPETGNTHAPFPEFTVLASMDSPHGPWRELGSTAISSEEKPSVLELDEATWARFLKFTTPAPVKMQWQALPERIEVWEQAGGANYTSILTEWGYGSKAAFYESTQKLEVAEFTLGQGPGTRETSIPLNPGEPVQGAVALGKHSHWYRLAVPADHNTLTITLAGDPTVRTVLELEDAAGEPVRLRKRPGGDTPGEHRFEAQVEPGGTYFFHVWEPPRNVVFTWDTSPSVQSYIPTIYNALVAFSNDVVPGRDSVNLIPFGSGPLLRDGYGEPYILQTILNDYPRRDSSSSAELTLLRASELLGPLPGTKAIVTITDAATVRDARVWDSFESVRPRVFGFGVAGTRNAASEQDLLQDWSDVNAGHYAHMVYAGEMEIAFDRAVTLMKRPAEYRLEVSAEFREAPGPGHLRVESGQGGALSSGAVELILDASGSMLQRLDGRRRINIAKDVLIEAVERHVPQGTPVALRVFGHIEPNACRTDLVIPLRPLDAGQAAQQIRKIEAKNLARTPIADSLAKIQSDLEGTDGKRVIVLVTDGEETCDGEPDEVIEQLQGKGFDITLNIVGFAIGNEALEEQFAAWAELGGGSYFSATNEEGLSEAIQAALQVPFTVFGEDGAVQAEGWVDGDSVELPAGRYRVSVGSSPARTFDRVEIAGESSITLELK